MRRRAYPLLTLCAGLAVLFLIGAPAGAERAQDGTVIVSLDGGISPNKLPRDRPAPVAVHLAGGVSTSDDSPLPRVNWIRLELAWRGQLFTKGLAVCPRERLGDSTSRQALNACGDALVGRGKLYAVIFLPNQTPFGVHANLLTFNGRTKSGDPAVWAHAYSSKPPVSFVIPFEVRHQPGAFRTVLVTTIRRSVGPWPHVANFHIRVEKTFMYRGERRSYLSASCPVPPHFTAGFLSLARATYTFAGGTQVTTESVRSCRTR
jgi:hypothetical protein